jgi:hypothetical protein
VEPDPWTAPDEGPAGAEELANLARQLCEGLVRLAESNEAARLLGVDGTLEDEVDIAFALDPISWVGSEVANALRDALDQTGPTELDDDESDAAPSLSLVVALIRLAGILRGARLTPEELTSAVVEYMAEP